jgi:hypothetical protein
MFQAGPLTVARFGKDIIYQTDWDPALFEEMQKEIAGRYDNIVQEIDDLVEKIAGIVSRLPALKVLHRAWWEASAQHLKIETEVEIGADEALALRMVDYVQSMIAAVRPEAAPSEDVSDDDWGELGDAVRDLFNKLNGEFHISSTLRRKRSEIDYDEAIEEFKFRAQIYWVNVRRHYHHANQVRALRDLLEGQDDCLQTVFGLNADQLVGEFEKIWRMLIFGVGEAMQDLEAARAETLAALDRDVAAGEAPNGADNIIRATMDKHGISVRADDAAARFFGYGLFDLQEITALPTEVLDMLSWEQGQEPDFMAPGPMKGWPLRIWPIFRRPFIKIDGKHYCFDIHNLFDHIFRVLEKIVFEHSEKLKQKWIENRKVVSEKLPAKYLASLLPGSTDYGEVFYPRGKTKAEGFAELDRLLLYDDNLFIIEVKGGSFTYTSPADDFAAHVQSMKALLESPATQARRFLEYLRSADEVPIFNKAHKEIARIRAGDYRHITICAVSIDSFTEFAAQARHLAKLGLTELDQPIWSVSIDDLRVFADVFDTPIEFLHFVEQRQIAFGSELLALDDELDHVGLYLEHNNYSQHAADLVESPDIRFSVLGYRSELDRFYNAKLADPSTGSPLSQKMPTRMKEVLSYLSKSDRPGRVRLGCSFLDMDGDARSMIFDGIEAQIVRMRNGNSPQAISCFGDVRITALPWGPPAFAPEHEKAVRLTRAVIAAQGESDRLLFEPTYFNCDVLANIDWQRVSNILFATNEHARMQHEGAVLQANRVNAAKGKTGPNDPCPCGSGLKYKKCHRR